MDARCTSPVSDRRPYTAYLKTQLRQFQNHFLGPRKREGVVEFPQVLHQHIERLRFTTPGMKIAKTGKIEQPASEADRQIQIRQINPPPILLQKAVDGQPPSAPRVP